MVPPTETKSPRRRLRRKRPAAAQTENNDDDNSNDDRPPPPPPPPDSLVRLLQSDARALHFFTSLQANLDADVKKWKDRASKYQQKCQKLEAQLAARAQQEASGGGTISTSGSAIRNGSSKRGTAAAAVSTEKQTKRVAKKKIPKDHDSAAAADEKDVAGDEVCLDSPESQKLDNLRKAREVEEAIFMELSSSSSSSSSEEEQADAGVAQNGQRMASRHPHNTQIPLTQEEEPTAAASAQKANQEIYEQLSEAYSDLERLGVCLVTKESVETTTNAQELSTSSAMPLETEQAAAVEDEKVQCKLCRSSDERVAADLLYALHTLTRLQLEMQDQSVFPPFVVNKGLMIPCFNDSNESDPRHPATLGKELVLHALSVMYTYCEPMPDKEWNDIFLQREVDDDEDRVEAIREGMRGRRVFVDKFLLSLQGEIGHAWSLVDRSSRTQATTLQMTSAASMLMGNEEQVNREKSTTVQVFGARCQHWLSLMAERCLLAQIVVHMHHYQSNPQSAASLLWNYVISTVPSFGAEDYPCLPPVMSLCVVEAILVCPQSESRVSLLKWAMHLKPAAEENSSFTSRAIALAIHTAAQIWRSRLQSSDDRIADISRVELAAYERICHLESMWLQKPNHDSQQEIISKAESLLADAQFALTEESSGDATVIEASAAVQIALIVVGTTDVVKDTFTKAVSAILESINGEHSVPIVCPPMLCSCCAAIRHIQVRRLETLRANIGVMSRQATRVDSPWFAQQILRLLDSISSVISGKKISWSFIDSIAQCLSHLLDAEAALRFVRWLAAVQKQKLLDDNGERREDAMASLLHMAHFPTVRVINLQRRTDRMSSFLAQAHSEVIMMAKAVTRVDLSDEAADDTDGYFWGCFAFDGLGRMLEVETRLSKIAGSAENLGSLVETHWMPSDLSAFDKDARDDDQLVRMSPSERACALSHIASWRGALRTLRKATSDLDAPNISKHDAEHLENLVQVSGYACGKPLLHSNENMAPSPVAIILEDDAILVDRFRDRLSALLQELPRDFHFCSLGYSRPKTAPLAKFSTHLGIPSCIWYLTGYVLSLAGAEFLLKNLPVKGPVDSWIGLKMCYNWDNVFGQALGVGVHTRPAETTPSRQDLARILRFRAFAALVPLCHQKLGMTSSTATVVGRSWRHRDTDITYSGA